MQVGDSLKATLAWLVAFLALFLTNRSTPLYGAKPGYLAATHMGAEFPGQPSRAHKQCTTNALAETIFPVPEYLVTIQVFIMCSVQLFTTTSKPTNI